MKKYTLTSAPSRSLLDYQKDLNPEQWAVVSAPSGAILVIAGAGTGKTRALTYRVAHLVDCGVPASSILLCTFTNKAAREMLSRVEGLVGGPSRQVWGGTFHHLANRLLREFAPRIGYDPAYTILDEEDARDLMASCLAQQEAAKASSLLPRPGVLTEIISLASNTLTPLDQIILRRFPSFLPVMEEVLSLAGRFQKRKRDNNAMDFDDLMTNLYALLSQQQEIREIIGGRFSHVLVDEYQDTNALQCQIVDLLASVHRNVLVVGDDAQSIYGFRGADPTNILLFPKRWPEAALFKLQTNYRSTPQILTFANGSIRHNRLQVPKELVATRDAGPLPILIPARDARQQAAFVAQRVMELMGEGASLRDLAVLYRAHHQSLELQVELTRRNIPYIVRSGVRFFEQAHIKDVLAYLRLVENPKDELSWMRLLNLQPGIGRAGALKIWQELSLQPDPLRHALKNPESVRLPARTRLGWDKLTMVLRLLQQPQHHQSAAESIRVVLAHGYGELLPTLYSNHESRHEDLEQLARYADNFLSIRDFLSELHLLSGFAAETVAQRGRDDETLTLSSVHQAKGLEWKAVFIIGANEGVFPHPRSLAENGGEEEERRLFYVAVTRAKQELYITSLLVSDRAGGRRTLQKISRFVEEVVKSAPPEAPCLERWSIEEQA